MQNTVPIPTLLVATDVIADAKLVRKLLRDEFDNVFLSTDPDQAVQDFESHQPGVLILAFDRLAKAERYYLRLYRQSKLAHTKPHRTVVLCDKDEVHLVYDLCKKDYFDDYVLFWPMSNDAPRLLMAVTNALRELQSTSAEGPTTAQMAYAARRIMELESLLEEGLAQGSVRTETCNRSLLEAEAAVGSAIDTFSKKLMHGDLSGAVKIRDAPRLQRELGHLKTDGVGRPFSALNDAVRPMGEWIGELKRDLAPHLESVRALKALSARVRPVVLVVDDDELERDLIGEILSQKGYELLYAGNGAEALGVLRKKQPDLILMDVRMPGIDGVEVLRRLKAAEQFANIPVMMITGQSEKDVVVESLKAGAVDFVVKPPDPEVLLMKVAKFLAR